MTWTDVARRAALGWAACWLVACSREAPPLDEPKRPALAVASPKLETATYERQFPGEVHALRHAEVRSRLKGLVESVAVDEGQAVKAGQALFSISAAELTQGLLKARAATKSAEAELKLAELEADSTQMLFEKKVVSSAELELARSKVEALRARVEEAKASSQQLAVGLTYAKVRAPFDGVVNRIPRKTGSVVGEDELLTTITDTSEVFVYFRVSEQEYLEFAASEGERRAAQVSLQLADGSLHPQPGVIDAVESEISRDTGKLAFRARYPNPSGRLKHGSSAKVVVRARVEQALLVPQKSTFEIQGRLFVYSIDAQNITHAKQIVPKLRVGDSFVLASGLEPQDRFVVEGVQKLKEGMQIDAVPPS